MSFPCQICQLVLCPHLVQPIKVAFELAHHSPWIFSHEFGIPFPRLSSLPAPLATSFAFAGSPHLPDPKRWSVLGHDPQTPSSSYAHPLRVPPLSPSRKPSALTMGCQALPFCSSQSPLWPPTTILGLTWSPCCFWKMPRVLSVLASTIPST